MVSAAPMAQKESSRCDDRRGARHLPAPRGLPCAVSRYGTRNPYSTISLFSPFSFVFALDFVFAFCAGWDKFTFADPWSDIPSVLYLGTALVLLVLGVAFLIAGVGALRS